MSESAVLEVSTADTDASDSTGSLESSRAELHDLDAAPPLLMETKYDIAVQVDAPMKQLSTLETYVTYRVRCACARWATPPYVRRRYNHFKALRQRLVTAYPLLPVPPLPPLHTARQQLDRYSASFVAVRTRALHAFLDCVAKHPILTHSEDLHLFVTERDDNIEKALKPDGSHSLWNLGSMLSGLGTDSRASTVRVKEPEFGAAGDYLQSLQSKLTTLSTLTSKLFKDSAALGREMTAMKPVADAWCSHERGALAAAVRATGAGCAGAGAARGSATGTSARAVLPHLAAYAGVVREKILERDVLHNTYASSNHTEDETHNRLEQASESLRSELEDWNAKTKAEIRTQLLDIAERQVLVHQQALVAWEEALKACKTPTNIEEIFKTVSKTAVLNLSPTRSADLVSAAVDNNICVRNGKDESTSDSIHSGLATNSEEFKNNLENSTNSVSSASKSDLEHLSVPERSSLSELSGTNTKVSATTLERFGTNTEPTGTNIDCSETNMEVSGKDVVLSGTETSKLCKTNPELSGINAEVSRTVPVLSRTFDRGNGDMTDPLSALVEIDLSKEHS